MLYLRNVLILIVSLYTVRIVLDALGVEDYGIYAAVAGVVTIFSFVRGTMASASQRFFSYALGQKDALKLKKTFTVNWIFYVVIALVALLLLETLGLWFVTERLEVPAERFDAAIVLYHYAVLTLVATIFTTPFMAMIIAHEDMQIYAYVSVVEALLKLGVVFLLLYVPGDKLELYGLLLLSITVLNAFIYLSICLNKYQECQFQKIYWDRILFKEIIGFTGWTLFGQITTVFRNQAVTILLNQVFNPTVVAARAISVAVASRINLFANNFNVGLYPPIIKTYADNDRERMMSLIFNGSKITFFLNWVFSLPLLIHMDAVLSGWLKNPPSEAVFFTQLALVEVLIMSLSLPLTTAARAPGKMKVYELTLGIMQIMIFVVSLIVLNFGAPAYSVFVVAIIVNLLMFVVRLYIVRSLIDISVSSFVYKVVLPVLGIITVSAVISILADLMTPESLLFTLISILISVIISTLSMFYIGLNKIWRDKVILYVKYRISAKSI